MLEDEDEPGDSFVLEPDESFEPDPLGEDENEDEDDAEPAPSEPVFAGAGPSPPEEDPPSDPLEAPPSDPLDEDAFRALAPRSFFAQPDPLKWIVGAVNALRTSWLPQTGQLLGPASWTPCSTSKRCPLAQT